MKVKPKRKYNAHKYYLEQKAKEDHAKLMKALKATFIAGDKGDECL